MKTTGVLMFVLLVFALMISALTIILVSNNQSQVINAKIKLGADIKRETSCCDASKELTFASEKNNISVVIRVRNGLESLKKMLKTYCGMTSPHVDLIVVMGLSDFAQNCTVRILYSKKSLQNVYHEIVTEVVLLMDTGVVINMPDANDLMLMMEAWKQFKHLMIGFPGHTGDSSSLPALSIPKIFHVQYLQLYEELQAKMFHLSLANWEDCEEHLIYSMVADRIKSPTNPLPCPLLLIGLKGIPEMNTATTNKCKHLVNILHDESNHTPFSCSPLLQIVPA